MKPTSRKRKVSAVKAEATRLHSKLVRLRDPFCRAKWFRLPEGQQCGTYSTDAAHVVGRTYSHTRTDLDNAIGLCATHHRHFTNWPKDWLEYLDMEIGMDAYEALCRKALAGVNVKFDWYQRLDQLKAIAEEWGLAA